MNSGTLGWLFFRALRWAAWGSFVGFSLYFLYDRRPHFNQYGSLQRTAEIFLFGGSVGAVLFGLLELMMRDRAGLPRPRLLRDWLGPAKDFRG
jgi:hypothetical protein